MNPTFTLTRRVLFYSFVLAIATLALLFWQTPSARAGTIIHVKTLTDSSAGNLCSLRDAIISANTNVGKSGCLAGSAGADDIVFDVSGTIVVTGILPYISESLTIDGGNKITLSGGGTQSILATTGGSHVVNLYNLTIRDGYANGSEGAAFLNQAVSNISNTLFLTNSVLGQLGGAVGNFGTMGVYSSTFFGNKSTWQFGFGGGGGAMANLDFGGGASMAITNSTFISNSSNVAGGALENRGDMTVTNSTFTQNQSGEAGGAIRSYTYDNLRVVGSTFTSNSVISTSNSVGGAIESENAYTLTVLNSTFTNNSTAHGAGGGVYVFDALSGVIGNSTFSNNVAGGGYDGGGIEVYASPINITNTLIIGNQGYSGGGIDIGSNTIVTITNSTISGNSASHNGGGIQSTSTPVTITLNNVTIANNIGGASVSFGDGGGIYVTGTVRIKNSIIAGNRDLSVGDYFPDCVGIVTSQGNNLLGDNSGCTGLVDGSGGNKVGTTAVPRDPLLGPLTNLGGPTLVLPLKPGSPASDAGSNGTCAITDQRGVARPINGTCDMGAFEGLGYWLDLPLILR